ncbi:hypothetical protein CB0940_05465 [Cercospora beticola]|uniref:Uncharacterized protein n=1 Tax=Cercospora beticola TaxID=122368 RepID=A0A2G5I0B6_CERBT|nr:hypothetical protein CB0940_05465 [Cercospora beticola]PIA98239.1 hypothetical protein CB0940_05465 [Cercospora beticola]WPA98014.1 hypothetical protein RHO25_002625 [Cercospora beticola]CAK1359221.1 unnamed protein product [Cercospora beticola]
MQFQLASLLALGLAVCNVLAAPVSGDALVPREEQAAQTSNDFIDDAARAAGDFSAAYQNGRDYRYGRNNPYDRDYYYDGPYQNDPYGRHRYGPGYDRYGNGRGPWWN